MKNISKCRESGKCGLCEKKSTAVKFFATPQGNIIIFDRNRQTVSRKAKIITDRQKNF